jgi:hypothetical protein
MTVSNNRHGHVAPERDWMAQLFGIYNDLQGGH